MLGNLAKKIFGSRNDRTIKRMMKKVEQINALEPTLENESDAELQARSEALKTRAQSESLDDLLVEAFALVREVSKRILNMRHFDVQMVGGMTLHEGKVAEMKTGEGKTLMSTLAVYLNALTGKGVHVVTVNDYLARRDADIMRDLYGFLGMSVGVAVPDMDFEAKKAAYNCDITYATNNELGFDYLRDNMAFRLDDCVQREHIFAVVDEVDSILIDEARTPLIISGPAADNSESYAAINQVVPGLERQEIEEDAKGEIVVPEDEIGDFYIDLKNKQAHLTERGYHNAERLLVESGLLPEGASLYDANNIVLLHHLMASIRAHHIYQKNVDYIVRDGQIVIIDEFTGRAMNGRRWSEGLHQAVEAKESLLIQQESQTLASITFQNYFRLYDKLAGMTGTADTEAVELNQIYGLDVVVIPTNRPMLREDHGDMIFLTQQEKYQAITNEVRTASENGQPVLIGTASIESSEILDTLLTQANIKHNVLNAKQHEREAGIIAEAGRPGAITIATNMAGRGTDIVLGGNLEMELSELDENTSENDKQKLRDDWKHRHQQVIDAGGLYVIGTERHESRRIDNQLRGRSGRQGDPGASRFYLSLEDNLMRIFANERTAGMMKKLGMEEGEAISHPWVSKSIENAQRKVEGHNFDIRKNLLQYDDVNNDQRKVVYQQRRELMSGDDISDEMIYLKEDVMESLVSRYMPPNTIDDEWEVEALEEAIKETFNLEHDIQSALDADPMLDDAGVTQMLLDEINQVYDEKVAMAGEEQVRHFEKAIMLQTLDKHWKDHLAGMDYLRQSIGLRGYAQKNPTQEYKREAFEMFTTMLGSIKKEVVKVLSFVEVQKPESMDVEFPEVGTQDEINVKHDTPDSIYGNQAAPESQTALPEKSSQQPYKREGKKIGRNEPCWCGSGKKYKQCHGKLS